MEPSNKRERLQRACAPYITAISIFLSSRLVMALGVIYAANYVGQNPAGDFWNAEASWCRYLLRYDSGWYLRIVREGYSYTGDATAEQPVVFYPLYPLISRFVKFLFGVNEYNAVLLVANASIMIAIPLLYKLVRQRYDHRMALWTVAALSFFPTSFFFSAGYTESLTLLLIVIFFLLLKEERFFLAACCAGLATASRSTGLMLLLPLLWELWRKFSDNKPGLLARAILCGALATSGLWLYMIYLWRAFGSPLAFMESIKAWHTSKGGVLQALTLQPLAALAELWGGNPNLPNRLGPWFFVLFVLLLVSFWRRLPTSYALYALGAMLLPYFTLSSTIGFISFTRYLLMAFPLFVVMGQQFAKRWWLGLSVIVIFGALLFTYTAMFAQWYWAG